MKAGLTIIGGICLLLGAGGCSIFQQDVATTAGIWEQREYYESGAIKSKTRYKVRIPKEVIADEFRVETRPEEGRMLLTATNWVSTNVGTIKAQGKREEVVTKQFTDAMTHFFEVTAELLETYQNGGIPAPSPDE